MQNSLDGLNRGLDIAEEKISEHEGHSNGNNISVQREKSKKIKRQCL